MRLERNDRDSALLPDFRRTRRLRGSAAVRGLVRETRSARTISSSRCSSRMALGSIGRSARCRAVPAVGRRPAAGDC